jgi:signal transduction histidine kinase
MLERNPRPNPDGTPLPIGDVPIVRAVRQGELTFRRELRIGRPDGTTVTVLLNAAPLRDEQGRITSAVAVFQDITQIKDAEQLKDDFLALVSHELRTPLTTIQGGALLLQRDWDTFDQATRQEFLDDISSESRRLAGLIENMVQLANIRAGRLRMESEPVHVGRLLDGAVAAMRQLAPEREFAVEVEPRLLAEADAGRIDQVLRNLLHNAVKYSPAGTPIEVSAHRDGDMLEFGVRDHGPGISNADLALVFERFERTEEARRSNAPGMGLGLYLARHVIEAHGGRIWIERPSDGGTRVLFTLPAVPDDE